MIDVMRSKLGVFALMVFAEISAIVIAYQLLTSLECSQTDVEFACRALRSSLVRGLSLATVLGVFLWLRPNAFAGFQQMLARGQWSLMWGGLHFIGVASIFTPLFLFSATEMNTRFGTALEFMLFGLVLAAIGGLLWLASPRDWAKWLSGQGLVLPLIVLIALVLPDFADALGPVWGIEGLSRLTFQIVAAILFRVQGHVYIDEGQYIIGVNDFVVRIASQCSGVEGFALVTVFLSLYALMLHRQIRLKRFWLVLFPLALLASWTLNIFRITVLILIGANYSPEHALNGFHSYAGWMLFTLLALAILVVAQSWSWLHRDGTDQSATAPLASDRLASLILPFVVMMASGVVVTTFWQQPELAYPYRALVLIGVIWYFRKPILALEWRLDPLALFSGVAIGVVWAINGLWNVPANTALETQLAGYSALGLIIWVVARVIGTSVLVPVIEELFFRGYILKRLDLGGFALRLLAMAVSSGLFALLHDRWLEAFAAGMVFAWLTLRSGRLGDAIVSHAVANALIAVVALLSGNWALI